MSSVSLPIRSAPISSIALFGDSPNRAPHASRSAFMKSAFGIGFGDAMLTTPETSSFSIRNRIADTKSR